MSASFVDKIGYYRGDSVSEDDIEPISVQGELGL